MIPQLVPAIWWQKQGSSLKGKHPRRKTRLYEYRNKDLYYEVRSLEFLVKTKQKQKQTNTKVSC